MKSTITYERLFDYIGAASAWLKETKDSQANSRTKLGYAIQRMSARAQKLSEKYQRKLEDLRIEHCSIDDKGLILRDERNQYRFTKDGLTKLNRAQEELYGSDVEIEPYYATAIPKDLSAIYVEAFFGIVIDPAEAEKLFAEMETDDEVMPPIREENVFEQLRGAIKTI